MKAKLFLHLVSQMMTAQQDYFKARKSGRLDTHNLLVAARDLEKKVLAVVDEGVLESDTEIVQGNLFFENCCQRVIANIQCGKPAVMMQLANHEQGDFFFYVCADCLKEIGNSKQENDDVKTN